MELTDDISRIVDNMLERSKDPVYIAECQEREKEQRVRAAVSLIKRSDIPKKYQHESFNTFTVTDHNTKAVLACRDLVEGWPQKKCGGGLAIFGDIGVGKTHLAISVLKELMTRYAIPAKYANTLHTFELAKWSFDSDNVNPIPILLKCPFLVLDDLGSEHPTAWTLSQMLLIVDYRLGAELPMLITSNASNWEGLMKMLSGVNKVTESGGQKAISVERTIDRLREMVGDPVVIQDKSWRGR